MLIRATMICLSFIIASATANECAAQQDTSLYPSSPTFSGDKRFEENAEFLREIAATLPKNETGRVLTATSTKLYPEVAFISGNRKICSGVAISQNAVLTAAHCSCDKVRTAINFGETPGTSLPGTYVVDHSEIGGCPHIYAKKLDIAVYLVDTIAFEFVPPTIVRAHALDVLRTARVVGYGVNSLDARASSGIKRFADIPIASPHCDGMSTDSNGREIPDSLRYDCKPGKEMVAARPGSGQGTCDGDSGGPLYLVSSATRPDSPALLAGLTSRRIKNSPSDCGDGAVYTLFSDEVLEWLAGLRINNQRLEFNVVP